jgi:glycosyltransferase involved in cell wall biosynthesis
MEYSLEKSYDLTKNETFSLNNKGNMKKILFDLIATQPFGNFKYHGGGLYGEVLFKQLVLQADKTKVFGIYNSEKFINPELLEFCKKNDVQLYDNSDHSIRQVIEKNNIQKYYSPFIYGKIDLPETCAYLSTIHGLRDIELPFDNTAYMYSNGLFRRIPMFIDYVKSIIKTRRIKQNYKNLFLKNKIQFITVSNHTKYSIKANFPFVKEDDIKVCYSPLQSNENIVTFGNLPDEVVEKKYFLLTNGNRWTKNNIRGAIALDQFFSYSKESDLKVVITGVPDSSIYKKKLKNLNRFIFLNYVDRNILNSLIKNAFAFIYPSLNEGFGYPPLEAMQYGVPVISSSFTSIQEVCESAALYFNPYSVMEIKNRIYQLLNPNIYKEFANKGFAQYLKISNKQKEDLAISIDFLMQ